MARALSLPRPSPRVLHVLALGCLLACASDPTTEPERSVLMGNENRVFMVLPLNVAAAMPEDLSPLSPIIWKQLELYLRAQGKELKTISREAARTLWIRSIRNARATDRKAGYDDAARSLAQELAKHTPFDAMIAPSLFLREARIKDRTARWDGVVRELEFDTEGFEARTLAASTPLEGVAPAASLHVAVFDASGAKLHEAQGGLDVLIRVEVQTKARGELEADAAPEANFQFVTRSDVFSDVGHLREGFDAAFVSFLPPLP